MKKFLFLFIAGIFSLDASSQKIYTLSVPREVVCIAGGGTAIGISLALRHHTNAFTPDQVNALDGSRIGTFDRFATRHYSASARRGSDFMLFSSMAVPLLLLADPAIRRDAPEVSLILGEVMLINAGLTLLTKELAHRPRPFVFNPQAPMADKIQQDARLSFFSGHTSTVAALTFSTAKIWSDYHPDSRWRPVVWVSACIIPAVTGYLRMRGGKHYLSDVLAGFAVGAVTGLLIPQWHHRR